MEDKDDALDDSSYWGEIVENEPTSNLKCDEIFQPKAAECDQPKLYQISSKQSSTKEYVLKYKL